LGCAKLVKSRDDLVHVGHGLILALQEVVGHIFAVVQRLGFKVIKPRARKVFFSENIVLRIEQFESFCGS
jgi:hypothetical protein